MAFSKDLCQALKPVKPKIRSTAMFIVIRHDTRRWIWIIDIARLHVAIIWITHNKEIITIYSIFHDLNVYLVVIYFSTNYLFVLSTFFHHLSFLFSSSSIIITFITYIILHIYITSESFLFIIRALKISAFAPQNTSLSSRGSIICKYISRLHKSLEQQSRRK